MVLYHMLAYTHMRAYIIIHYITFGYEKDEIYIKYEVYLTIIICPVMFLLINTHIAIIMQIGFLVSKLDLVFIYISVSSFQL